MEVLNGFWPVFAGGTLGVVLMELAQFTSWRQTGKLSYNYRDPIYWATTAGLLIVSGFAAVINGTEQVNLLRAIQLGINAPALFAGYASTAKAARLRKLQPKPAKGAAFMAPLAPSAQPPATLWQRITELRSWN